MYFIKLTDIDNIACVINVTQIRDVIRTDEGSSYPYTVIKFIGGGTCCVLETVELIWERHLKISSVSQLVLEGVDLGKDENRSTSAVFPYWG